MKRLALVIAVVSCGGDIGQVGGDASSVDAASDAATDAMPQCPSGWYDCAFGFRQALTIDYSTGNETLTDVPVLIVLNSAHADLSQLSRDSLRFVDASGQLLAHEVESVASDGAITAWLKIPTLSAGTSPVVTAYYGNAGASQLEQPTLVWSNSYAGVWHLSEDPAGAAPQMRDQTSNANHGTSNGSIPTGARVQGAIAEAVLFDGATQWIQIPDSTSLNFDGTTATLSAWFKMTNLQSNDMGLVIKSSQPDPNTDVDYNYQLTIEYILNVDVVENYGNFRVRTDDAGDSLARVDSTTLLSTGTWYHVTGVYDGSNAVIYINGEPENSEPQIGNILPTTEPLLFGRRALGDERYFDGAIDEVRVTEAVRSTAWIHFQYQSMTDQVVDYGPVEELVLSASPTGG